MGSERSERRGAAPEDPVGASGQSMLMPSRRRWRTIGAMDARLADLDPIAGVSLAAFVAVSLELARFQFDAGRAREVAADLGIPAAAWVDAAAGWSRRLHDNPAVAAEFSRLYRRGWGSR
jgi:hypothetical protein